MKNSYYNLLAFLAIFIFSTTAFTQCDNSGFSIEISYNSCQLIKVNPIDIVDLDEMNATYNWDFGDGNTYVSYYDTIPVEHYYNAEGTYTISLTIDDGLCSYTATISVIVTECLPGVCDDYDASFVYQAIDCYTYNFSQFSQVSPDDTLTWDFGDGTIITYYSNINSVEQHTFSLEDDYLVTLHVQNGMCTDTYFTWIQVYCDTSGNGNGVDTSACYNLYNTMNPVSGYYQNFDNQIMFQWGNNNTNAQNVQIVITFPNTVTPAFDTYYSFNYPWVVSGNQILLDMTLPPNSSYYDIIEFYMPFGIPDSTLHTYSMFMEREDGECGNLSELYMLVGNSYDPNAKIVNKPIEINPDIQDELEYTIYFQNTGTAPAQDISIIDTLDTSLDWSTFAFVKSSHAVHVNVLGNGVVEFAFNQIWLPDSTTDLLGSQGFVTFKIKENASNSVGTSISNTAYIYFDVNDAIITNTTYNINSYGYLGLENDMISDLVIFPNPTSGIMHVKSNQIIELIEVYSLDGKRLQSHNAYQKDTYIDLGNIVNGVYLIKVSSAGNTQIRRIVKG